MTLPYGEVAAGSEMSTRLRRVLLAEANEIDLSIRDGFNLVLGDSKTRTRLIDAWGATLEGVDSGLEVRAVVDGKLVEVTTFLADTGILGVPGKSIVGRSDIPMSAFESLTPLPEPSFDRTKLEAKRETLIVQVAEAENAVESARTKHEQALEGLKRREEAAREALSLLEDSGNAAHVPELDELRQQQDAAEKRLEAARLLMSRLEVELDVDRANRHVRQAALTRVGLNEVEDAVSRRRGLIAELGQLGAIDGPVATGMGRAFGAVTAENSIDPLATQLTQRWQEVAGRKATRTDHPLMNAISSAQQRLGMARAEFERLRMDVQQPTTSGGTGGLSVIEQALHLVLDEASGENEAADRLRREMLHGPGPLMELEGWSHTSTRPQHSQLLEQSRTEVERLQVEVDQLQQQHRLSNTVDIDQVEAMLRDDVVQYLGGRDPGDAVPRELAKVRVIPAIQRAVYVQLAASIESIGADVERLRSTCESSDRDRVANTARKAGARSGAMRAVADVEAHRRETARVAETMVSAAATVRLRSEQLVETDKLIAELPDENVEGVEVVEIEEPPSAFVLFVQERLASLPVDTPVFFDNTFSNVEQAIRWEVLSYLHKRSDVQCVYLGESSDLLNWAETCDPVTIGRI
jgi:hypothetical protein